VNDLYIYLVGLFGSEDAALIAMAVGAFVVFCMVMKLFSALYSGGGSSGGSFFLGGNGGDGGDGGGGCD
tara:strand:- start:19122 stop:19328 length:207 start_codon:yes stop_codon:yes gene_type:complete